MAKTKTKTPKHSAITPNLGISSANLEKIGKSLLEILTNTYALLIKTHNYHWNIRGTSFKPIHELTEDQYNELFAATDVIAERIRTLGLLVSASISYFAEHSSVKEPDSTGSDREMVKDLLESNEILVRMIRKAVPIADEASDEATSDLLTERLIVHEKASWMLRSFLEE